MIVINQKKIAELAGVSVSTVSKAFSGSHEISEKTREEIFRIAKSTGAFSHYVKEVFPKKIIGVIAPEAKNSNYTAGLSVLDEKIKENGDIMLVSYYNFFVENMLELIDYFADYIKVDGIIVLGDLPKDKYKKTTPLVSIANTNNYNGTHDVISAEIENAMSDAIAYLKSMGHRNIAYIGELLTSSKKDLFEISMAKNSLEINDGFIRQSKFRHEKAGYFEMNSLLTLDNRPTAIVCAYDSIAFGVITALIEKGLSVPDDFSLVGMNDIRESYIAGKGLTTILETPRYVFDSAAALLYRRMAGEYLPRQNITVSAELIVRGSVKDISH